MDLNPSSSKKLAVEPVKCPIPEMDSFPYNLPDTCLNTLFDNLPLEDLLHCNLVCRKWNQLYRAACSRRRKLTLIIGDVEKKITFHSASNASFNSHPFSNWDDKLSPIRHSWLVRKYGELDHRFMAGLMRNLVNITSLEMILTHLPFKERNHMLKLLHFWAEKLVSLKLWLCFVYRLDDLDKMDSMDLRLIDTINSLTRLTHLTLNYEAKFLYTKDSNNEPIMQIKLENLTEFNLKNYRNPDDACKAICGYAKSHPNLRVGFDVFFQKTEHVDLLFSYDHQVASQITQLCLNHVVTKPLLTRVCGHFTNLTTLQLANGLLPASQWTKAIAQCSQLVHLRLDLKLNHQSPDLRKPPTKKRITQLKSIKMLSIAFYSHSHFDLQTLKFTWIFPNLEKIYIEDNKLDCNICGIERFLNNNRKSMKRYDKCFKLLLSPLKEFKHLEVIKYFTRTNGSVFYSKEELY